MLPVIELIAQNVLTTVQGITAAAGFNFNLTAQRHSKKGDRVRHLNGIIVQEARREVTDKKVYNTNEWWLPFGIGFYVIPAEEDQTPIDTYANLIMADVEKALMADRYRGGNAINTVILPEMLIVDGGLEFDLVVINVEVHYRTSELDPYLNAA